ncbi:MAG: alpha-2-macroglobulin family protein, partial [Gemmataceae bacterium]
PRAGHKSELKVASPVGVTKRHALPAIKPDGVVLSISAGVVKAEETIPVTVRSTAKRSFMIGAYCRGRLLDSTELSAIHFTGDEARAVLRPASGAGGVCRVTVFEILPGDGARRALRPVAERLIYRQPAERVQLALKPDQKTYVPRQTVKLGVEATTEKGEPAPAVVMLRVVDKSVVTLADDKTLRGMPTHFLLTTEVRRPEDLEYADFLLGPHPRAAEALDLLLGTQGWRRFAEQDPNKFRHEQKEEAERLLVTIGQSQPQMMDLTQKEVERVESEYARRTEALTAQAAQARKEEKEAREVQDYHAALVKQGGSDFFFNEFVDREDQDYHAALVKLKAYDDFFKQTRLVGVPVLAAILALTALVCLLRGLRRQIGRALPYYAATVACVAVVVLLAKLAWHDVPELRHGEHEVASLTAPKNSDKPKFPENERLAKRDEAEGALRPQNGAGGGAMLPRARAQMAKPGLALGDAFGMAPDKPAAGKGGFGNRRDRFGEGKDVAKMEQLGRHKGQNRQLELKEALPRKQLQKKADGDRAEQPRPLFDDKGDLRAAMPPRAPRMAGDIAFRRLMGGRGLRQANPWPPMPVRIFAHPRAAGPAEVRYDFAETLYWHPVLVLPGGKTEVSFDLCDSLGAFEVTAFAHTLDGRLGSATRTLTSRLPFTVQPRTPLEVTAGDKIDIPLAIANNTSEVRTAQVAITDHANLSLLGGQSSGKVSVPANTAIRKLYRFQPTLQEGTATLSFTGKANGFPADS